MIADRNREDVDFPNLYPRTLMTSLPCNLKFAFDEEAFLDNDVRNVHF